jgi:hypothetical protein
MSTVTQQVCSVIPPHIIRHAAAHACDEATRRKLAAPAAATLRLAASRDEAAGSRRAGTYLPLPPEAPSGRPSGRGPN